MFKQPLGIALLLTLSAAGAQTAQPVPANNVVTVTATKPTSTGESAKVFTAKRQALKRTMAYLCAVDTPYFSAEDDAENYIEQLEAVQEQEELNGPNTSMRNPFLQKFNPNAPFGDVSVMVDSSSITGAATSYEMGPCGIANRKEAAGREHIARNDTTFNDGMLAIDAKEYGKAAALLETAYKKVGYPEAAVLLARLSLGGQGVPRSTDKALYWLDRAAGERFDPKRDRLRFTPNDPHAMNGMVEAALILARLHLYGADGVKKDPAAARKWYAKAAEFGYVPARLTLGRLWQAGAGGAKDADQARKQFLAAAEEGYLPAQFTLAKLYYFGGNGTEQDLKQAARWFAEAAAGGQAQALYALGRMHDLGEGMAVDQAKAIVYYKEAALKSEPDAQNALASYFYTGDVVPKNLATARKLYNEAAMQGQADAMFNLAVMSLNGEGGEKDAGMAYVWFSLAKSSGHERAAAAIAQVGGTLTASERARADAILHPAKQQTPG